MKLKYYLRGLGLGTVLTAIIMGVVLGKPSKNITDAEVIKRAKQLGMVEAESTLSSYSESSKNPEESDENVYSSSNKEVDKEGEEISEEVHEGEPEAGDAVSQVVQEAQKSGETGESSESVEPEEDVKLASNEAGGTVSTDVVEAKGQEGIGAGTNDASNGAVAKDSEKADESSSETVNTAAETTIITDESNAQNSGQSDNTENANNTASVNNAEATNNTVPANSIEAANNSTSANNAEAVKNSEPVKNEEPVQSDTEVQDTETSSDSSAAGNDVNYIVVDLPSGSESDDCARILREAGVIDDGVGFNKYLISSGQDRRIRSGSKQIPKGSSFEEIAAIITK
ncbi:hypothetical protein [Butyrivibrio sp. WCE2006]|uniref:hypothetical protein n=1 Tax=Butyrivibrio sp. WCE2006 TaxID=1410611 RepID=UPI0006794788|nr:hypothetical protein [Butyrivibrio sp. WCE2006]